MNLTSKLGKGLRTGILATTLTGLIGLTGCAELEGLRDQIILEGAAARLEEKGEFRKAESVRRIGDKMTAIKIAEAGRSEVNVYTNRSNEQQRTQQIPNTNANRNRRNSEKYNLPPENVVLTHKGGWKPAQGYEWVNPEDKSYSKVRKKQSTNYVRQRANDVTQSIVDEDFKNLVEIPAGKFYIFAANYFKDFNDDRSPSPNEYVGIKKRFRDDEMFQLILYDQRDLYGQRSLEVYSPKGEKIYERRDFKPGCSYAKTLQSPRVYWDDHVHKDESGEYIQVHACDQNTKRFPLLPFLIEKGGYGNYKTVWKLDGKYDGSTEFEIVPS